MRARRALSWSAIVGYFSWRRVIGTLIVCVSLAAIGYAGYLLGRPELNPDALRSAAAAEGRQEGAKTGAKEGYAQGYRSARERTYVPAYSVAYREAYMREFELADLDPPQSIRVPEPR
jgi:hypothetical protein